MSRWVELLVAVLGTIIFCILLSETCKWYNSSQPQIAPDLARNSSGGDAVNAQPTIFYAPAPFKASKSQASTFTYKTTRSVPKSTTKYATTRPKPVGTRPQKSNATASKPVTNSSVISLCITNIFNSISFAGKVSPCDVDDDLIFSNNQHTKMALPKCSHNPSAYYEEKNVRPKECYSPPNGVPEDPMVAWPKHAFVINLPSKIQDFHSRRNFLQTFGINLQRWPAVNGTATFDKRDYGEVFDRATNKTVRTWYDRSRNITKYQGRNDGFMTLGERGYLESMKRLFTHALSKPEITSMLVVDEDVVFDCNLKDRLLEVLKQPRCGGPVSEQAANGGVLILGASIWVEKVSSSLLRGWALTNEDISASFQQFGKATPCFNVHSKVYGSFAVIYHRSTFEHILRWIRTASRPFDHIYPYLYKLQHVVRVAYPFIAIQDVGHVSSIDNRGNLQSDLAARAKLHHWQLDRYCYPDFTPLMSELVH